MGLYDLCWLPKHEQEDIGNVNVDVTVLGNTLIMKTIKEEVDYNLPHLAEAERLLKDTKVIFGKVSDLSNLMSDIQKELEENTKEDGYVITEKEGVLYIIGNQDKGVLYGMFHFFRLLQRNIELSGIHIIESPVNSLRMINHWDNIDDTDHMGSVERGYAGHSIFYRDNKFVADKTRIKDYARLVASVGINAVSINNVNVHELESNLITDKFIPEVKTVCDIFAAYGVKLFLSVNYASTITLANMETADPRDKKVQGWWNETTAHLYSKVPNLGGFLVKADSEGRPGPFTYGRNQAEGANMLAAALKPHGGILIWRCFVYNCQQDWRDRKTDRARAAYDYFKDLDGDFLDNVALQIKNGPMDFQVREPISPLLGAMDKTNQIMEFQIAQEYTGQQKHICYLIPQWKEVFNFDTFAKGENSIITKVASGELYNRPIAGVAAVSNIGDDYNWCGHKLAQANLYGYGRLIWNPNLSSEEIATEWIELTFGQEEKVVESIKYILLNSWLTYEKYTSPLGVGWMIEPNHHYGPNVDGYEYARWGTYHFADRDGIGVDRTIATGTGYTGQYFSPNKELYENIETCPDEMLLFFHHVPYSHILKSGETVIQHIYNTHFEGVEEVQHFIKLWDELEGKIDEISFRNVHERLEEQLRSAKEWRDQINTYFYRKSGVEDAKGRKIY